MGKKLVSRLNFSELAGVTPASITKACRPGKQLAAATDGKRVDANHPAALAYLAAREEATKEGPATGLDPRYEDAVAACTEASKWTKTFIEKTLGISFARASGIVATMNAAGLIPEKGKPAAVVVEPHPAPRVIKQAAPRQYRKKEAPEDYESPDTDGLPEYIEEIADLTLRELVQRFGTETRFKDWLQALKSIEDIREKRNKNALQEGKLIPRDLVETHIVAQFERAHIELMTDGAQTMAARLEVMFKAGTDAAEAQKFITGTISKAVRSAKATIARVLRNA